MKFKDQGRGTLDILHLSLAPKFAYFFFVFEC